MMHMRPGKLHPGWAIDEAEPSFQIEGMVFLLGETRLLRQVK